MEKKYTLETFYENGDGNFMEIVWQKETELNGENLGGEIVYDSIAGVYVFSYGSFGYGFTEYKPTFYGKNLSVMVSEARYVLQLKGSKRNPKRNVFYFGDAE